MATYTRTPSEYTVITEGDDASMAFYLEFSDVNDPDWIDWQSADPAIMSWRLWIQNQNSNIITVDCQPYPSGLVINAPGVSVELGEYSVVSARGFTTEDCSGEPSAHYLAEYADGETVFEVVGEEPPIIPTQDFILLIPVLIFLFLYCFFEVVKMINK